MNILFLMADEFRYDLTGFAGNSIIRTPNLDALATGAAVFDNAYTPCPVCVPGRQCMATGKYPLHIGCQRFGEDIAPGSQTFARWFTDHGYYTVACGKLHHRGPDQMQGWMHRIGAETAVRWPESYADRSQVGRNKWKGAEELKTAGPGVSALGMQDDLAVQGACDFLRMHFGGLTAMPPDIPLFLMVSLNQPHFPLRAEKERFDYYLDRVPVIWDEPATGHPFLDKGRLGPGEGVTREDVRRATAAYYAMVELADARFGRVLETLREMGQNPDEWLIVFTADHGDMLGQHGAWEKRKFYEGSVRVPLVLRGPGIPAGHTNQPANLVDLFPTLAQACGLPAPTGLDGSDLFSDEHPDETFSQYDLDHFMLRQGRWKYMSLPVGGDVLFDLEADPGETQNLINDPAHAADAERLRRRISEFLAPTTCTPAPSR